MSEWLRRQRRRCQSWLQKAVRLVLRRPVAIVHRRYITLDDLADVVTGLAYRLGSQWPGEEEEPTAEESCLLLENQVGIFLRHKGLYVAVHDFLNRSEIVIATNRELMQAGPTRELSSAAAVLEAEDGTRDEEEPGAMVATRDLYRERRRALMLEREDEIRDMMEHYESVVREIGKAKAEGERIE